MRRRWLALCVLGLGLGWFLTSRPKALGSASEILTGAAQAGLPTPQNLSSEGLAQGNESMSPWLAPLRNYPEADTLMHRGRHYAAHYHSDSLLQAKARLYMRRFRPETGTLLVSDLATGRLLAAAETRGDTLRAGMQLALQSGFPAASLIKIITAAAGLEGPLQGPDDSLPQLGSNHTLYRYQLKVGDHKSCPKIELREAFARSVNPAFAVLGMRLGPKALQVSAERFGFNAERDSKDWRMSRFAAPDSGFPLAEVACGFTDNSTISPLHALQIARALGQDGRLLNPAVVSDFLDLESGQRLLPLAVSEATGKVASSRVLSQLQDLMEATTRVGTARKGFHRAMRAEELNRLETGGKTGSLDGAEPPGRYEWFIGYARLKDNPGQGIAVAVMLIHEHYLAVHASELAAHIFKEWLRGQMREQRKIRAGTV